MSEKDFYRLTFTRDVGKAKVFTVRNAKPGLEDSFLNIQLGRIVNSDALSGPNGAVTAFKNGTLINETRTALV